jgi:hypothetical protein
LCDSGEAQGCPVSQPDRSRDSGNANRCFLENGPTVKGLFMFYTNDRTAAFVVTTPKHLAIMIRRPQQNTDSGYSLWTFPDRPFAVCAPSIPLSVTPGEFKDRVISLAKIGDARNVEEICQCFEHVLDTVTSGEETERRLAEQAITAMAKQFGRFAKIFREDLKRQGLMPDDEKMVLDASRIAPLSYIRGWGWGHGDLTVAKLQDAYTNHTWHALTNALRDFRIGPAVLEQLSDLIFDQIMSVSLSVHAKRVLG